MQEVLSFLYQLFSFFDTLSYFQLAHYKFCYFILLNIQYVCKLLIQYPFRCFQYFLILVYDRFTTISDLTPSDKISVFWLVTYPFTSLLAVLPVFNLCHCLFELKCKKNGGKGYCYNVGDRLGRVYSFGFICHKIRHNVN